MLRLTIVLWLESIFIDLINKESRLLLCMKRDINLNVVLVLIRSVKQCNPVTQERGTAVLSPISHIKVLIPLSMRKDIPSLYYPFRIYPLRVIKQIITMFFSINNNLFRLNHPDLVKFVLNKHERYLSPDIRILVYFTLGPHARFAGGTSISTIEINPDEVSIETMDDALNQYQRDYAKSLYSSEIAFPPLGYVLSFGLESLDSKLADISFFAKYSYDDWTSIYLKLPVFPVNTWHPGDYRSKEQLRRNFEKTTR